MKNLIIVLSLVGLLTTTGCSRAVADSGATDNALDKTRKVAFIEIGSINCVPCRAMQPIMEEVRQKYGDQVEVLFYDVWTEAGKPYVQKFRIRVIPTQIFLDKDGKEYFRHEGYFPMEELTKALEKGGVTR